MTIENLPVLAVAPDWSNGILETLTWNTALLASTRSGANGTAAEQRRKLRLSPRIEIDMDLILQGPARTYFDLLIHNGGNSFWYVPLWWRVDHLKSALAEGAVYVDMPVAASEYPLIADDGSLPGLAILVTDAFTYEVVECGYSFGDSHRPDGLYISATANPWPRHTRILPCRKMQLLEQPQFTRKTDSVYMSSIKLQCLPPADWTSTGQEGFGTYKGRPVFLDLPNEVDDLAGTFDRFVNNIDSDSGLWINIDTGGRGFGTQTHAWMPVGRMDHAALRDKLYALAGRYQGIYLPTFMRDLEVVYPIAAGSTNMTIKKVGYTDLGFPVEGRNELIFFMKDGTYVYATIAASAVSGTSEIIGFDAPFGRDADVGDILRISFLQYSRLDQDAIEIAHQTDDKGGSTSSMIFRSITYDRNAATWEPPALVNPSMSDAACGSPLGAPYFYNYKTTIWDDPSDFYQTFGFDDPTVLFPANPLVGYADSSFIFDDAGGIQMTGSTGGVNPETVNAGAVFHGASSDLYAPLGGSFTLVADIDFNVDMENDGSYRFVTLRLQGLPGDYVPLAFSDTTGFDGSSTVYGTIEFVTSRVGDGSMGSPFETHYSVAYEDRVHTNTAIDPTVVAGWPEAIERKFTFKITWNADGSRTQQIIRQPDGTVINSSALPFDGSAFDSPGFFVWFEITWGPFGHGIGETSIPDKQTQITINNIVVTQP